MTDPNRWIDDPATSNRLRVALRQYPRPSPIAAEALGALGAALDAALDASTRATSSAAPHLPSAGPSASIRAAALTKAGLIAIATGLGGAGWFALSSEAENAAPVAATALVVASPPPNAAPAAGTQVSPTEALRLVDQTAENAPTTRSASDTTPRRTEAAAARGGAGSSPNVPSNPESLTKRVENAMPDKSQLQREATLLEMGRRSLPTDPSRALEQTALHRERFAEPMLGFERDLLEMDALCRVGNTAKAERIANNLLKAQPAGPYAERARAILARANRNRALEEVKERRGRDNQ